mmetsp:Transcript_6396/g.17905  ORF Transcript_6396/g.17905 Transcript_6396/m.17905 type:complete len:389 (-) Transcript_6396:315-1481(-)
MNRPAPVVCDGLSCILSMYRSSSSAPRSLAASYLASYLMVLLSAAAIEARSRNSSLLCCRPACPSWVLRASSLSAAQRRSASRACWTALLRCSSIRLCVSSSWLHRRSARCSATTCSMDFRRSSESCCSRPARRAVSTEATGAGTPRLVRRVRRDSSRAPLSRCFSSADAACRVASSSADMHKRSLCCSWPPACRSASASAACFAARADFRLLLSRSSCPSRPAILAAMVARCDASMALPSSISAWARCISRSSLLSLASPDETSPRRLASTSRRCWSAPSVRARCDSSCSRACPSSASASSAFSRQDSAVDLTSCSARRCSCSLCRSLSSASLRARKSERSAASRSSRSTLRRSSRFLILAPKSSKWESLCASAAFAVSVSSWILAS